MIEAVVIDRLNLCANSDRLACKVSAGCLVADVDQHLSVCLAGDSQLARQVAGLLLWKLHSWGDSVDSQVVAPNSLWPLR